MVARVRGALWLRLRWVFDGGGVGLFLVWRTWLEVCDEVNDGFCDVRWFVNVHGLSHCVGDVGELERGLVG